MDYNVLEAALWRFEYIYKEFDGKVVIGTSGGKDSAVILGLAKTVARKLGMLPVKAMWLDQEAEWNFTVDYFNNLKKDPEVEFYWYQIPLVIFNATSHDSENNWLNCWAEDEEWIRPKDPDAITENTFGTKRFAPLFEPILKSIFPDGGCYIAGMRAEESPRRTLSLTMSLTYKWITYGRKYEEPWYVFYPIYDWRWSDVWKYILDNDIPYNKLYDLLFQYGIPVKNMRVSNLHHETAVHSLLHAQEMDSGLWNQLTTRLDGVNTVKHLKGSSMKPPKVLPEAFTDWKEYRDYLTEHLVLNEDYKKIFKAKWERMDEKYEGMYYIEDMYKAQISAILLNDWEMTKISNWETIPEVGAYRQWKWQGKIPKRQNKYING